ncbi:protoporphyrinogen oxidase [Parasphingorhabdus litoris]|uniref:Protoporphyrinogen oxidase n=1 Tax=Parasphingorhabdus litoris TaxID=394733 RepID=A0ABN1A226_9SPHN|nr:FAD-dependent oxidoreductase [Parasphingorhabdus litoris]
MKIAVVGAGIAGLAASHELSKRGHDVEIYEASDRAGGRGKLLNRPGTNDWADVGSQYFHSNYSNGLRIIDELGLTPKLKKIKGSSRMFTGSSPGESYLLSPRLPWINPGGLSGNLKVALYSIKLLLKNRSHTFGAEVEQAAYDAQLAMDSTSDKFVQDQIVRMLTLVGGLSEPADKQVNLLQIYRLLKIIMLTDYVSLEGGTATLHQELARLANIHYNSPVKKLQTDNGNIAGLTLENGDTVAADHVVVAAHAPRAADILPTEWALEKDYLSGIEMPPAILVSLFLDCELEKDVWTYFFPFEDRENRSNVTFCVDTHQKSPGNTPSGKATLQAWIISPQSESLLSKTDDELAQIARRDVAQYLPHVDNHVEGYAVTRHQHAIPQSSVGHNERTLTFLNSVDQRPGVSFCGDYMSGGYMESALWSVERAIKRFDQEKQKLAA